MNPIKFVLASRWIAPNNQGGVAMHHGYLAGILKDFCKLHLISLESNLNKEHYQTEKISFSGIKTKQKWFTSILNKLTSGKNFNRFLHDDQVSKEFSKVLLHHADANVVEFMDIHSEGLTFLKQRDPSKVKVHIRSHTPWTLLRETYTEQERKGIDAWFATSREHYCFHAADVVSTPSQDLKRQLIQLFDLPADKIKVIPNLLDTDHFKPMEVRRQADEFVFLHVGRFERAKGVLTLTKAFIELAKIYPQVRLINVGKPRGAAYETCKQWIEEAGLSHSVTFTGFVPYDDLPLWYAKANVVVVPPEIYESFSYTVAQAMACGKWVIASNSGGMPETLNFGEFGAIFEKGNSQALLSKMTEALNQQKTDNLEARCYAEAQFGLQKNGTRFKEFYQQLYLTK